MFASVAAFEWRYQVKSPVFWVGVLLFFLLTFGATTVDTIQIGSRGNVNLNSPYAIVQTLGIMSLFAIFVVVAMVAGPVIRDDETGFAPILRSTRIGKGAYLGGRFAGALAAALLVLAAVPTAIALGAAMPFQDPEKIGPWHLSHYLWALFVFGLPTLLITGAGFFALATATRSMMWTYVGAVATLVLYSATRIGLRDLQHDTLSALTDPFGLSAFAISTRYWTASERNTLLPPLSGLLLGNRVLWTAVAAALFALAWRVFSFEQRGKRAAAAAAETETAPAGPTLALPAPRRDAATRRAQLWALARFDMGFVFRSPAFFVLLFIGVVNAAISGWYVGEYYGSSSWPATRLMVQALQGAFTFMPVVIAIYYGGELVWLTRDRRVHEIVDATAAPDWAHLLPKIVAIALVLSATSLVAVATGMAVQLAAGYTKFELGAYLLWFWLPTVIGSLQLAVLSVFVQVLVPQKYVGWGVMLVYLVASVALGSAGFEHNLYNYAGAPIVPLSDMAGMDRFWIGPAWFQFYWSACATLLALLSWALWRRGVATSLRVRLAALPRRLRQGGALALGGSSLVAFVASGAWIFVNTNLRDTYQPVPEAERLLAETEKTLLPWEKLPLPQVTAVTIDVQLFPREARAVTQGRLRLENRGREPVAQLPVLWGGRLTLDRFELAGATLQKEYPDFHARLYRLQPALQPGEVRELAFTTTLQQRGFSNGNPDGLQQTSDGRPLTRIVANGSFLDTAEIVPGLGINRMGFLKDRAKRRKHGLPTDLRPPRLEDESGRARNEFSPTSDWVDADITVTTDADQQPVAPGTLLSDHTAVGRRTAHFRTDAPIANFFSIQSARYEVRRDRLGDIDLAVYYHPGHGYNVDRMLKAMKASLALFSEAFSPYQFKQARILEFPSYARFAQSFANTIPYSEDIGFLSRLGGEDRIDVVTYVTAHEIAHQWWGHQLIPSEQQGASMLVESFAQYSSLLVMERLYGKEAMRKFLKYELDRYLRQRGGEVVEELPLARVEEQTYIHYQKGALSLYWLKEVVGEDKVNRALSRLLKEYAFKGPPYPNTTDFLRLLREEAGPAHDELIADLFERITLLDVKASDAKAVKRADGRWDLSFAVEAKKFHADGKGKETEAKLDEAFDVGAFTAEPGRPDYSAASVLRFERQRIVTGRQTVRLVVDQPPQWVGVDPYNKRIDRNSQDNLAKVEIAK